MWQERGGKKQIGGTVPASQLCHSSDAKRQGAVLVTCRATFQVKLVRCNLNETNLGGIKAVHSDFSFSGLHRTNFREAVMVGCNFDSVAADGAIFTQAVLTAQPRQLLSSSHSGSGVHLHAVNIVAAAL